MKNNRITGHVVAGVGAGAVNGLFGAGGGMLLVPLLNRLTDLEDREIFPASVCIILPLCLVSLAFSWQSGSIPWRTALPYLGGSILGGIMAGIFAKRISTLWLHRILGAIIIWGGIRYLC